MTELLTPCFSVVILILSVFSEVWTSKANTLDNDKLGKCSVPGWRNLDLIKKPLVAAACLNMIAEITNL